MHVFQKILGKQINNVYPANFQPCSFSSLVNMIYFQLAIQLSTISRTGRYKLHQSCGYTKLLWRQQQRSGGNNNSSQPCNCGSNNQHYGRCDTCADGIVPKLAAIEKRHLRQPRRQHLDKWAQQPSTIGKRKERKKLKKKGQECQNIEFLLNGLPKCRNMGQLLPMTEGIRLPDNPKEGNSHKDQTSINILIQVLSQTWKSWIPKHTIDMKCTTSE